VRRVGVSRLAGKVGLARARGFSQRAGYRPPGSANIEWFGEVSDGVEPQVYEAEPLLVVIDLPAGASLHPDGGGEPEESRPDFP
jgi:hypothetical protein